MAQYDLVFLQNVAASGVEFTERMATPFGANHLIYGNSSSIPVGLPVPLNNNAKTYYLGYTDSTGATIDWKELASGHIQDTDTGTNSSTFQLDNDASGVKIKNNSGVLEARNAANDAYADFKAKDITATNDLTVTGNLIVQGTTTTLNTTNLEVEDKNIELGKVPSPGSPTDNTADGGGITLLGTTNKTILWDNANDNWSFNQSVNILSGLTYKINNTSVLSSTEVLGLGITSGTVTSGIWNGTVVSASYGGTGLNTYAVGDILYASGTGALSTLSLPAINLKRFLFTTGAGATGELPSWQQINLADSNTIVGGSEQCYGILPTTSGGTGSSTIGTANQILGVNAAAGALEYKSLGSTGSTVTITYPSAGSINLEVNESSTNFFKTKLQNGTNTTGFIRDIITNTVNTANVDLVNNNGITYHIKNDATNAGEAKLILDISDLNAGTALAIDDHVAFYDTSETGVVKTKKMTTEVFQQQLNKLITAPLTPTSTGKPGATAFDGNYFYYCYGTGTWARSAMAKNWV